MASASSGPREGYVYSDLWGRWMPERPGPDFYYSPFYGRWIKKLSTRQAAPEELAESTKEGGNESVLDLNAHPTSVTFQKDEHRGTDDTDRIPDAIACAEQQLESHWLGECPTDPLWVISAAQISLNSATKVPCVLVSKMLSQLGENDSNWYELELAVRKSWCQAHHNHARYSSITGCGETVHDLNEFDEPWSNVLKDVQSRVQAVLELLKGSGATACYCRQLEVLMDAECVYARFVRQLVWCSDVDLKATNVYLVSEIREAARRYQRHQGLLSMSGAEPGSSVPVFDEISMTMQQAYQEGMHADLDAVSFWGVVDNHWQWLRDCPDRVALATSLLLRAPQVGHDANFRFLDAVQKLKAIRI